MKIRFYKGLALALIAMTAALSCSKEQSRTPVVGIMSDASFEADYTATATLNLSVPAGSDVIVTLASAGTAAPQTTAIPGSQVSFPASVTILAGSTGAEFTVSILNPEKLSNETYSAGIQIVSAKGATISPDGNITYIKLEGGYSGGGIGGGNGEGTSTPGEGSQEGWSISYKGYGPFTYTSGGQQVTEDCEIISYTVPATQYVYLSVFDAGVYEEYIKDQPSSKIITLVNDAIAYDLSSYGSGYTAANLVYAGPDEVGFEEFEDGEYEAFIFGTDKNGNPDGTYAWCSFTKTGSSIGGELDVDLTLQPGWTLTVTGNELEYDGQNNSYIAARITAPGSSYIYVDSCSDDELDYYYDGSLSAFAADIQSSLQAGLASSAIDELLYTAGDCYIPYYKGGETTFYIFDFDSNGKATGKYGKVIVDLPELSEPGEDEPVLTGPLSFQSGWKAVYSGNYRIDVSGVTDQHFMFDIYRSEIPEADLEDELIDMVSFNLRTYGYVYDGPSDYDTWDSLSGSYYVYIAGLDDDNNLTGKYGYSVINVPSTTSAVPAPKKMRAKSALRHLLLRPKKHIR